MLKFLRLNNPQQTLQHYQIQIEVYPLLLLYLLVVLLIPENLDEFLDEIEGIMVEFCLVVNSGNWF